MPTQQQGLFVLGVQIQNIAEEIKKLERLGQAANDVQAKLNTLGKAKGTAVKLGFVSEFEKSFGQIDKVNKSLTASAQRQKDAIKNLTKSYRQNHFGS